MKKWAQELNGEFSKEKVQMMSKYTKKCSTSLVIKEMKAYQNKLYFISPQLECP
jgi:hypothetical protein